MRRLREQGSTSKRFINDFFLQELSEEAWTLRDEDPRRAKSLAEKVLAASEDSQLTAQQVITLSFLSYREGRFDLSLEKALEALRTFDKSPHVWLARLYNTVATNYMLLGERPQSFEFFLKQLDLAQGLGTTKELCAACHDLAIYFFEEGNVDQVFAYFEKARAYVGTSRRDELLLLSNY